MMLLNYFSKLNKYPLYLLLFLLPIFFFPLTQNILDFPKQILAQILIALSFIGWMGKSILEGEIHFKVNKIFYFIIFLILILLLLSSFFSISLKYSLLGLSLDFVDSFLNYFVLIIFAFLLINNFVKRPREIISLIYVIIFGGIIAAIFNLFQMYNIFLLPFDFSKSISFNSIGTPNSISIFFISLLPLSFVLALKEKGKVKLFLMLGLLLFFLNVLFIDFKIGWLGLIVSILVLFIFIPPERKLSTWLLIALMVGLIFSIFFYFFPLTMRGFPILPSEVSLSVFSEVEIIKNAFSNNIKNMIFGTGPATFVLDYAQYRSPLLNQSIFWDIRFSRGYSMFFDWMLTKGILGIFALLFLYIFVFYFFLKKLKGGEFFEIKLGISASLFSLIFISFFYPFNFTLWFLFWFLVGLFGFFFFEKDISFKINTQFRSMVSNFVFVMVLIVGLSLVSFNVRWYLAEMYYFEGLKETTNFERATERLLKATRLNPLMDNYWRDLSQLYLLQANSIIQNQKVPVEEKRERVNFLIGLGAESTNRAINLAPFNVINWNARGFFYQNLVGIEGAENQALISYRRAMQLEPSSPFPYGELARVYILLAQNFAQKGEKEKSIEYLNFAKEALNMALELKQDYSVAHYLLAAVLDQLGNIDEAIERLEWLTSLTPQDFGVRFQLGVLYWKKGEIEKAKKQFEEVIVINPDYSNGRYMLGLVLDKIGEREKAIEEFEIVAKLNPENEEVKKILENLKNGLPALQGIIQDQQQIEENLPQPQR